jgi:Tfp pilus assembly protein PilF
MARTALHEGRLKDARAHLKRSLRLDESDEGRLLEADVHLAGEDLESSLRVLEDIQGPAVRFRLAELLRRADVPLGPRELLERMPRRDMLVTLAEHFFEQGELRKASRTLEICLREGLTTPRVLILIAAVELASQRGERAEQTLRLAFREL